jgi:hypothetical protein
MRRKSPPGPSAAALAAAFAARRCVICGTQADVVCLGSEEGGETEINLCLGHAAERWPWKAEAPERRQVSRR